MRHTTTRLTQRAIDLATAGERQNRPRLRDHEVPGFQVVLYPHTVAFVFEYKPKGRDPTSGKPFSSRYITIGDDRSHSLDEARDAARKLRQRVRTGGDPKAEDEAVLEAARREQHAAAATAAARVTCKTKLALYADVLADRGRSARHHAEELGQTRRALAGMDAEDLMPGEVTPERVEKMLAACPAGSRAARFSAVGRFLRWACKGSGTVAATLLFDFYERPRPPASRTRVLTLQEIGALWRAAAALPYATTRDLVQFLIGVPCRRSEAAHALWRHVDLAQRVWTQPTTKNTDGHAYPLNALALAILRRRQPEGSGRVNDLVFPGPRKGEPFGGWSNLANALVERVPELGEDWRLHDLRRSFVTLLAEHGHDEIMLDVAINHRASKARGGVRGVYQRAQRWPERVAALNAWAELLGPHLAGTVTQLKQQPDQAQQDLVRS